MLKFVVLLCCSVACVLGEDLSEGLVPRLDGRIVGGDPTDIGLFPWQVSLQRYGYHICGGAIYNSGFIVTAAHCFENAKPSTLSVRAGSSFWKSGGIVVGVKAYKIHEGFNPRTMVNDIAIIRLSSSLTMSSTIKPIPLATTTPPDGADAIVSGWGSMSSGGSSPSQLRSVILKILSLSKCGSSTYGYGNDLKKYMLCTYAIGKDACQGDSGGPLVSGGELVGVVSWGYGCAHAKYPGVYTDVAAFRSWVISTVSSF